VIVLEDLRWADGDTVELAEHLAGNVSGLPVVLGLTRRASPASTALEAAQRQRNPVYNHPSPAGTIDRQPASNLVGACRPSGFRTAQAG
jgi:hypothetical protein